MSTGDVVFWLFAMTLVAALIIGIVQFTKVRARQRRDGHTGAEASKTMAQDAVGRIGERTPNTPGSGR